MWPTYWKVWRPFALDITGPCSTYQSLWWTRSPLKMSDVPSPLGPSPSESYRTKAVFPLFGAGNRSSWSAVLLSNSNNTISVAINSPSDAVIGHYIMSITGNSGRPQPICGLYLLFNPWIRGIKHTARFLHHFIRMLMNSWCLCFILISRGWCIFTWWEWETRICSEWKRSDICGKWT